MDSWKWRFIRVFINTQQPISTTGTWFASQLTNRTCYLRQCTTSSEENSFLCAPWDLCAAIRPLNERTIDFADQAVCIFVTQFIPVDENQVPLKRLAVIQRKPSRHLLILQYVFVSGFGKVISISEPSKTLQKDSKIAHRPGKLSVGQKYVLYPALFYYDEFKQQFSIQKGIFSRLLYEADERPPYKSFFIIFNKSFIINNTIAMQFKGVSLHRGRYFARNIMCSCQKWSWRKWDGNSSRTQTTQLHLFYSIFVCIMQYFHSNAMYSVIKGSSQVLITLIIRLSVAEDQQTSAQILQN